MIPVATSAQYATQLRALLALALPGMLSTYCFFAISLTQLSIMGHLGVEQLAAVAYSQMSMDFSTLVFMQGFNSGMNALCSQAFGAKNFHLIGQYGQLTATMLTIVCVPMALLWWNLGELLLLVGVKEQVAAYARVYCRLWILGMWPRSMFQVLSIFYQSQQIVLPTTAINGVTVVLNFFLASGLTHGSFGLPKLGFIGCPLGTTIAMWVRLVGYYYYMHVHRKFDRKTHAQWTWQRRFLKMSNLKTLMAIGFPLAAGNLFENAQLQTMALFAAKIGEVQLGTHNSMMELFFFATSPIYGLLDASITLIGKQLGAGHASLARALANLSGICIGVAAIGTSSIMVIFRQHLGRLFSDDPAVLLQFQEIVAMAAVGYVFLSFFCYAMVRLSFSVSFYSA